MSARPPPSNSQPTLLLPPLVCAFETATPVGSVALVDHGRLIGEWVAASQEGHSRILLAALAALLEAVGKTRAEMTHVAVSRGPGSFTGLRVGMALAKGLAQGLDIPLIAVPTLAAFARAAGAATTEALDVAPILDARKGEVYAALFRGEDCLVPEMVCSPEAWAEHLSHPTLLLGEGARRYRAVWERRLGDGAHFAPADHEHPRAAFVGALAVLQYAQAHGHVGEALGTLVPTYLRRSEAELNENLRVTAHTPGPSLSISS